MLRAVGLDDHVALTVAAPRPSRSLRDQLECTLRRAKIRNIERHISRNDPGKTYIAEVQPLGDDLRSDEDLCLSTAKSLQFPRQFSLSLHRI